MNEPCNLMTVASGGTMKRFKKPKERQHGAAQRQKIKKAERGYVNTLEMANRKFERQVNDLKIKVEQLKIRLEECRKLSKKHQERELANAEQCTKYANEIIDLKLEITDLHQEISALQQQVSEE